MCKVHLETFRTSWCCSSSASGSSGWIRLGLKFPESDSRFGRRTMKNLTFLNLQG
jgi:hypothetical protein